MAYSYEDVVRGGKGNMSIIRFVRGTQEQFDKMDKTGIIQPNIYMKDDILYFVVPDDTKPVKVKYDDRKVEWNESGIGSLVKNNDKPESIEENPFLQESINSDTTYPR